MRKVLIAVAVSLAMGSAHAVTKVEDADRALALVGKVNKALRENRELSQVVTPVEFWKYNGMFAAVDGAVGALAAKQCVFTVEVPRDFKTYTFLELALIEMRKQYNVGHRDGNQDMAEALGEITSVIFACPGEKGQRRS